MRVCKRESEGMAGEGDYLLEGNHLARIEMRRWKESAIRPFKRCVRCDILDSSFEEVGGFQGSKDKESRTSQVISVFLSELRWPDSRESIRRLA